MRNLPKPRSGDSWAPELNFYCLGIASLRESVRAAQREKMETAPTTTTLPIPPVPPSQVTALSASAYVSSPLFGALSL